MPLVISLIRAIAFVTTFRHNVRGAELAGELLPRSVTAHGDDSLGAHLPGREHAQKADRAIADDDGGCSRLDVRCISREPAGAQYVGGTRAGSAQDHRMACLPWSAPAFHPPEGYAGTAPGLAS